MNRMRLNFGSNSSGFAGLNYNNFADTSSGTVTILGVGTRADMIDFDTGLGTGISLVFPVAWQGSTGSSGSATSDHHGYPQSTWQYYFYFPPAAFVVEIHGLTPGQTGEIDFAGYHNSANWSTTYTTGDGSAFYLSTVEPPSTPVTVPFTADGSGVATITLTGDGLLSYLNNGEIRTFATGPSLLTPTTIQGDGSAIAYTGNQLSTTEPVRAQFSRDNFVSEINERELATNHTNNAGGTFELIAGAETNSEGANGDKGSGIPYTQGGWKMRLVIKNEAGTEDLFLDCDHQPKAGADVTEFNAAGYVETGNGLLKAQASFIGDNDQIYFGDNQQTGGSPDPLTLDFNDPDHPLPVSIGGNSEAYAGPLTYAWYNTQTLKWIANKRDLTPFGYGG